jgi:hypothetical protein
MSVTILAWRRRQTPARGDFRRRTAVMVLIGGLLAACAAPVQPTPTSSFPGASPASSTLGAEPPGSPSPTPGPTAPLGWTPLAIGDQVGATWSSDGQWMLLRYGRVNTYQRLDLRTGRGDLVRLLSGTQALWLDDRSFVVFGGVPARLGTIDSPYFEPLTPVIPGSDTLDVTDTIITSGHGALAYTIGAGAASDQNLRYAIWTRSGITPGGPGLPVAWSADGSKLAVWHFLAAGQGTGGRASGWLQVLSWPGLRTLAADHAHPTDIFETFDPSGRYLVFQAGGIDVLDVATGAVTVADQGVPSDSVAWGAGSHLLLPAGDTGDLTTVDIHGSTISVRPTLGDGVTASTDGTVAVAYWAQPGLHQDVTLITAPASYTVHLPCTDWPDYGPLFPALSPKGVALVITCAQDAPPTVWLFDTATVLPR